MLLLLDIGGTKTRLALSDSEELSDVEIFETPQNYHQAITQIKNYLTISESHLITQTMVGLPGLLTPDKSTLSQAPHLPLWINQPIKEDLMAVTNSPVYLENDAALAALGEATYGAGIGFKHVAYLTLSTGVGGAQVIDGKLDPASIKDDVGHMTLKNGQEWESLISGTGIEKIYGTPAGELTDPTAWTEVAEHLAWGLNRIISKWAPEIIILGGGVAESLPFDQIKREMEKIRPQNNIPPVVKSKLGDLSGLYGALSFLKQIP
ncbi:MAG: ROK family protein [Candidatus Daviesbacteria bacterium]|nr:ROK family protein [Candidatus Daviesbacteria bacterium]